MTPRVVIEAMIQIMHTVGLSIMAMITQKPTTSTLITVLTQTTLMPRITMTTRVKIIPVTTTARMPNTATARMPAIATLLKSAVTMKRSSLSGSR